jgi:ribosomal-protein-alanine N-acetyltransferase
LETASWFEEARRKGEAWVGRWNQEQLAKEVQQSLWIIYEIPASADKPGGMAGFIFFRDLQQAWEISLTVVHPRFRGHRVFDRLFRAACEAFEAQGVGREVWLEVRADNTSALAAYTRVGFVLSGRRKAYYVDGMDALLMTRPAPNN